VKTIDSVTLGAMSAIENDVKKLEQETNERQPKTAITLSATDYTIRPRSSEERAAVS
jgi:hypothetical protein